MEQNMNNVEAGGLSEAAIAAIAGFARLGAADREAAIRMLGVARGMRVWTPAPIGALPTLTGLVPERDRETIYASSAWARDYRAVTSVIAYVLQARGLAQLSIKIGNASLVKVGTTASNNVARRISDLGSCQYGAWHRGACRYEHEEGFDVFLPPPRLQLAPQHPLSPVRLCGYGIEVGLPQGLSAGQFEAEFNRRMNPLRLQTIADSDVGRDLCATAGIEPATLRRSYRAGQRYKLATELSLLRPQADIGALSRLCEDIIIDAVLGLVHKRPIR